MSNKVSDKVGQRLSEPPDSQKVTQTAASASSDVRHTVLSHDQSSQSVRFFMSVGIGETFDRPAKYQKAISPPD